jgi:predicted phage terminase large subunit-like protein
MSKSSEIDALLRQDFASFVHRVFQTVVPGVDYMSNWHIEAMAWELRCVAEGYINRAIITLPPRHLKSIVASVAFPAWLLGMDPTLGIICVSYSQELANKHAHDMRLVVSSPWYKRIFPNTRLQRGQCAIHDLHFTRGGYRLSTSVGGTLTGRGGDVILMDDINKANEVQSDLQRRNTQEWFQGTLLSRLNDKANGSIVLIQQRLHEDDMVGFVKQSGNWDHLNLPAISEEDEWIEIGDDKWKYRREGDLLHPEREDQETLDRLKKELGSRAFAAQYQQRPVPRGGDIVKLSWFKTYDRPPLRESGDLLVQSWDAAFTANEGSDYSVCTTWLVKHDGCYLLHVERFKAEYPELIRCAVNSARHWQSDLVIVEAIGGGVALYQDLRARLGTLVRCFSTTVDKVVRMETESLAIETGYVFIPEEASWLADFQHELTHFPRAKHDDQVDSLSQFLRWWRTSHHPHRGRFPTT